MPKIGTCQQLVNYPMLFLCIAKFNSKILCLGKKNNTIKGGNVENEKSYYHKKDKEIKGKKLKRLLTNKY